MKIRTVIEGNAFYEIDDDCCARLRAREKNGGDPSEKESVGRPREQKCDSGIHMPDKK